MTRLTYPLLMNIFFRGSMRSFVLPLFAALVVKADVVPTSTHCDVAVLDDPLNFKTIYENRGQSKPERLPPGTRTMCNYYDSQEYVGPGKERGTCCTGAFVDNVIFPLHTTLIEKGDCP